MSLLLSDTQQTRADTQACSRTSKNLSLSHTHTRTHTLKTHTRSCTTARHYRADQTTLAQLWCMHMYTYTHTHTRQQNSGQAGCNSLKDAGPAFMWTGKTDRKEMRESKIAGESDDNQIECEGEGIKTGGITNEQEVLHKKTRKWCVCVCVCVCVRVCVSTYMCINISGAGSAERVWQTIRGVWLPHVVTLSLSGPLRRRPDKWDTSCWPEDGETKMIQLEAVHIFSHTKCLILKLHLDLTHRCSPP